MARKWMDERGLSLIEVVASIVILTLLLTTFMMMFLQSAKTNKASGEIVDATYTAQTAMENIYALSLNTSYSGREDAIEANYDKKPSEESEETGKPWMVFENGSDPTELIKIKLKKFEGNMEHVIVEIYEMPQGTLRAKMQTMIIWGAD